MSYMAIDFGVLIAALGVIITLSIAYSFFSIWKSERRFDRLEKKIDNFSEQIRELDKRIRKNQVHVDLVRKDGEIARLNSSKNLLQILKAEFEYVADLCNNYDLLRDEFQGRIGWMRSVIAHDLLNAFDNFSNADLQALMPDGLSDVDATIGGMWHIIRTSKDYSFVQEYEKDVFKEFYQIYQELSRQIKIVSVNPEANRPIHLSVNEDVRNKLQWYSNKL